jgi:PLD-like domain
MHARLVLQPFADSLSLFDVLDDGLRDPEYVDLTAVVAWAKSSGISRCARRIAEFRARGSSARILLGVDEGGATREGLVDAMETFSESYVVFDPAAGTFHPKFYLLRGERKAILAVGSNNLTAGGLYANYEAAVVLDLHLDEPDDRAFLDQAMAYVDRLLTDRTVQALSEELIERLVLDPRFLIGHEGQAHRNSGNGTDVSDSLGLEDDLTYEQDLPFGRSMHPYKRDPGRGPRRQRGALPGPARKTGGHAADAHVVARWTKKLSRSDCGQPREGSQTTAALRFTKAGHEIDQTRWFRHRLFSEADWLPDVRRPGREQAVVAMDVVINNVERGIHEVLLKHDAEREAGQHNFTTDLKWRTLSPILRQEDLTGEFVAVEKLSDGSYRLTIQEETPRPFIP